MNTIPVFVMLTKVSKTAQKYATSRTGSVRVSTTTAAGSATSATLGISSTPIAKVGIKNVRGRPYMTSAKFSGFWTSSPLVRIWD